MVLLSPCKVERCKMISESINSSIKQLSPSGFSHLARSTTVIQRVQESVETEETRLFESRPANTFRSGAFVKYTRSPASILEDMMCIFFSDETFRNDGVCNSESDRVWTEAHSAEADAKGDQTEAEIYSGHALALSLLIGCGTAGRREESRSITLDTHKKFLRWPSNTPSRALTANQQDSARSHIHTISQR